MRPTFIDPRDEARALRRAAVLLERVRQDGGAGDAGFEELQAGVDALRRAASCGRTIHHSAIDRVATLLRQISTPTGTRDRSGYELLRANALLETGALVERLTVRSEVRVSDVRASEERRVRPAARDASRPSPAR